MADKKIIKKYLKTKPLWKRKYFCYAPLTNLYFWQNGNVSACCQNRTPIGRYPEQTIREIWESEKANDLRHKMKICDLSAGCSGCEEFLSSMLFKGIKSSQYDQAMVHGKYPSIIEFALSNNCNLECIMCRPFYSSAWAKAKNTDNPLAQYDDAFIKQLDEFIPYLKETRFLGGEPFIINIYYEIWERIIQKNPACKIIIQTNASILPDRITNMIEKGSFSFSISIDSLQKETYEIIRKNASFDNVMHNINYLSDYCKRRKTSFGIAMCPLKMNWKEIPEFIDFCQKKNASISYNTVTWPLKLSLKSYSSNELHDICEYLKNVKFASGDSIHNKNVETYKKIPPLISAWENAAFMRESCKDADFDKTVAEIKNKIERAFSSNKYPEDKEEVKQKIINAIELLKDDIDFTDLHSNLLQTPDKQFAELIKNKSLHEFLEMAQEYIMF